MKRTWSQTVATLAFCAVMSTSAFAQDSAVRQLLDEADSAYARGDFGKAARAYDRAIKSAPKDVSPEGYGKRASIFAIAKHYQDGLRWITSVAEGQYPDHVAIREQKAVVLAGLPGRQKDAVDVAELVVKDKPDSSTSHKIIGDFYFGAHKSPERVALAYETYLKQVSQDTQTRVKLGFTYLELGRRSADGDDARGYYEKAEAHLDPVARGRSAGLRANANKGLCAAYAGQAQKGAAGQFNKAVTLCEQVIRDALALRNDPSPYFNVGRAYLALRRYPQALDAANSYIALRPAAAAGYNLRGEVYFAQEKYGQAEGQFVRALELAPRDVSTRINLGKTYSRQKRYSQAIDELSAAIATGPSDAMLSAELATVYLEKGDASQAAAQAEKGLAQKGNEKNARLRLLAARAHYAAGNLDRAASSYKLVLAADKGNKEAAGGLVTTLNKQAFAKFGGKDLASAENALKEALRYESADQRTHFNLGVIALHKGEAASAIAHLKVPLESRGDDLLIHRLLGNAYLMGGDQAKAVEHYRRAEAEAVRLRNNPLLAEIYVELAPLVLAAGKTDEAVDQLEKSVRFASGRPFESAAKRNLQLARFVRGFERLKAGNGAGAVEDLEGATREPALLKGNEEPVFDFALALAYVGVGQGEKAADIFERQAKKGTRATWLKEPWASGGLDLLVAYAYYRGDKLASWTRASALFARLKNKGKGELKTKLRDLSRSSLELIAYGRALEGKSSLAKTALKQASKVAGEPSRSMDHNLAVLELKRRSGGAAADAFRRLGDEPVEALVNLGVLMDKEGRSRDAYELWVKARSKGYRSAKLDEWIETKKRIFGY